MFWSFLLNHGIFVTILGVALYGLALLVLWGLAVRTSSAGWLILAVCSVGVWLVRDITSLEIVVAVSLFANLIALRYGEFSLRARN